MWEITSEKSASIRQPHLHRLLDEKRPTRAVEELHQVAAKRTERRLYVQVDDFPIAYLATKLQALGQ